jgi:hypothetical protein
MAAVATAQAQEAVGQDAAFEKGIELGSDELGQGRSRLGFNLGKKGFEVFLNYLVKDGVFGTPSLVVDALCCRRRVNRDGHRP